MIFSIDQNSHSLWDTLPKLQAVTAAGFSVTHFVEDIDLAFTDIGSDGNTAARIRPERFYPSGGTDWGASLFYHRFLGRQPVELRNLSRQLGMKPAAISKKLGITQDELYRRHAVSDNLMLIGPSFAGRDRHRVLGDLHMEEVKNHLEEIIRAAETDCTGAFPAAESGARVANWFSAERERVARLLDEHPRTTLDRFYAAWLADHTGETVRYDRTSRLFESKVNNDLLDLLGIFTRHYETAAALYNRAIEETGQFLHPLDIGAGQLPFHAVMREGERVYRTEVFLRGRTMRAGEKDIALRPSGQPSLDAVREAGIAALPGKALVLAIQARMGRENRPLVLPYRGSSYMPAAHRLARLLVEHNLLDSRPSPVLRVRFRFLQRIKEIAVPVRVPDYLAEAFGSAVVPARRLAEEYRDIMNRANGRLERFAEERYRQRWLQQQFPERFKKIQSLEKDKRHVAQRDASDPRAREIWLKIRAIRTELLERLLHRVVNDFQLSHLDFWDSRGALCPWAVALGGEKFYRKIIAEADIYEESDSA